MLKTLLPVVIALWGLGGCAVHRRPGPHGRKDEPPASTPSRVGAVASVNETLGFVLLDVGSLSSPAPGTALKSFSRAGAETAILAVGVEKQRPFVVADIVRGEPKVGDDVKQ